MSQFHPAQLHLHAVERIARNFAIAGKQAQRCETLRRFVENFQALAPGCFLTVVDLAQIQYGPLRHFAGV